MPGQSSWRAALRPLLRSRGCGRSACSGPWTPPAEADAATRHLGLQRSRFRRHPNHLDGDKWATSGCIYHMQTGIVTTMLEEVEIRDVAFQRGMT